MERLGRSRGDSRRRSPSGAADFAAEDVEFDRKAVDDVQQQEDIHSVRVAGLGLDGYATDYPCPRSARDTQAERALIVQGPCLSPRDLDGQLVTPGERLR